MKPYYQDNHVTIYNKDCRDMSELSDNSVQCVVTSPPYWGLRKYSGEQDLIKTGVPVASSTDGKSGGYFIADTREEAKAYIGGLRSRIIEDCLRLRDFKRASRSILNPEQLLLI